MRRTLFSDQPRASEVPAEPDPVSGVEQAGGDFGRWLTFDLRPKGAPSQAPPSERSSPPSSLEAQGLPLPAPEEPELASWLLRDLKPRSSAPPAVPPRTVAPARAQAQLETELGLPEQPATEASRASSAALSLAALPALASESLLPPDSLVPHAVSEAPRALAAASDLALDADDLAVLPSSRARAAGRRRWRYAAVLAALLGGLALLLLWRGSGSSVGATRGGEPAPNATLAAAPLPPPPPAFVAEEVPDEDPPAPAASSHPTAAPTAPEPPDDLSGPHGRRAGDAIARFADLPTPTLSKLARDERQKLRSRDASVRAQKAANNSRP
jgi:hypothetical protein